MNIIYIVTNSPDIIRSSLTLISWKEIVHELKSRLYDLKDQINYIVLISNISDNIEAER